MPSLRRSCDVLYSTGKWNYPARDGEGFSGWPDGVHSRLGRVVVQKGALSVVEECTLLASQLYLVVTNYSVVYGISAIWRDRLMASVT